MMSTKSIDKKKRATERRARRKRREHIHQTTENGCIHIYNIIYCYFLYKILFEYRNDHLSLLDFSKSFFQLFVR